MGLRLWVSIVTLVGCRADQTPVPIVQTPPLPPDAAAADPDPDPDRDLLLARCDLCPDDQELYQGIDDHDGCPDRAIDYIATPFGPWGVGFAKHTAKPEASLRQAAEVIAHDFIQHWEAIQVVGCTAPDEKPAVRAKRIDALVNELVAVGVDPAYITRVDEPCQGQFADAPHERWAAAFPVARPPAQLGCPTWRPRDLALAPREPPKGVRRKCKATECWLADEKRCEVPGGQLDGGVCGEPGGICTRCRCAAPWTPIDTPDGPRPIAELRAGDLVYSLEGGRRVVVPIARVHVEPVIDHRAVELAFDDGTTILISAGHPTGDGRDVAAMRSGDRLGPRTIDGVRERAYPFAATHDILPASSTGVYFSGGVPLGTTLR